MRLENTLRWLICCLIILSVGGCALVGGKPTADQSGQQDEKIRFEDEEGRLVLTGKDKGLPPSFPPDMPRFPKAEVKSSIVNRGNDGSKMVMVIFEARETPAKVKRFYKRRLIVKGWTISSVSGPTQATIMTVTKKVHAGSISISQDEDNEGTIVSISVSKKPPNESEQTSASAQNK